MLHLTVIDSFSPVESRCSSRSGNHPTMPKANKFSHCLLLYTLLYISHQRPVQMLLEFPTSESQISPPILLVDDVVLACKFLGLLLFPRPCLQALFPNQALMPFYGEVMTPTWLLANIHLWLHTSDQDTSIIHIFLQFTIFTYVSHIFLDPHN